jgi:hypothetical protein
MVDQLTLQTIGVGIAAISVVIGVINSILSSRREEIRSVTTLETRQAQLFMQLMDKYTTKEGLENLGVINRATWSSYGEWLELRRDEEYYEAYNWLANIYDGIGALLREGLLNVRMVALVDASGIIWDWEKYKDVIYEMRKRQNDRRYRGEWEYLSNTMMKYLEEHPELAP